MNQRRHMTIIAAVATLLASAPLTVVFAQWTWAVDCIIVVAAICGAALAARALRAPLWAQPLATIATLLLILTWLNPSGSEFLGFLPSAATFAHFGDLLNQAGSDIRNLGIPAQDTKGVLMLTTAGVGLSAVVIDFVTVGLRKPALAGLPMLAIYAVPVAVDTHSVNIIPFLIGACGYMWLLVTDNIDRVRLFGRRFTGDGRGVDAWEPSPLAAVGRRIAVIGMVLAVTLPVAAPGMTKGFFDAFGGSGGDHGGNGNCGSCNAATVDLLATLSGQLNQSTTKVMANVTTTDTSPGYLRLAVASVLTKSGFLNATPSGLPIGQGLPYPYYNVINGLQTPGIEFTREHAQVTLTNTDVNRLPTYVAPLSGTLTGVSATWRFDPGTGEIFNNDTTTVAGETYSFDYVRPDYPAQTLRSAQQLAATDPIQREYTKVPQKVPQVDKVLKDEMTGTTEYDKVLSLYYSFSEKKGYTYSTFTKGGTTGTEIGDFLTNKQGYCVQYAASLAWLVRAAGYPARVALGFTQGSQATPGHFVMTNLNLHAWTEVYFDGFGWVPFDATPSANIVGSDHPSYEPIIDPIIGPSTGRSSSFGSDASGGDNPSGGKTKFTDQPLDLTGKNGGNNGGSGLGWYVLGGLALILVILLCPFAARSLGRRRRYATEQRVSSDSAAPGEPYVVVGSAASADTTRARVHAAWDEFIDTLIDFQVPIDYAETPRTAAERVVTILNLPGGVVADVRLLGAAEERARYAATPGPTKSLAEPLRSFRRALAARVSLRTKLRATLLPLSVTQRWRAGSIAWWAQTVARTQSRRDRILRIFSIRRLISSPKRIAAQRTAR